jgi:hypothetical protein
MIHALRCTGCSADVVFARTVQGEVDVGNHESAISGDQRFSRTLVAVADGRVDGSLAAPVLRVMSE